MKTITVDLIYRPETKMWHCLATDDFANIPYHGIMGRGSTEEAALRNFEDRVVDVGSWKRGEFRVRDTAPESGAASILITLSDGAMTIEHGEDGEELATLEAAKRGDWAKLWALLEDFGFVRVHERQG